MMLSQSVKQISVEDVNQSVLDEKQVVLLDVRTPGEYERGHIKNSINVPVDDLEIKIGEAIPDKSKTVYAYCLSGSRSNVAVNILSQLGYGAAFSMANGLLKWRANKFELVS
jgi:rhodanese-related sulfurtransferase